MDPTVRPEEVGLSSARLRRVTEWMKAQLEHERLPGLMSVVIRRDDPAGEDCEPLGMVDTDFAVPADKLDRFAACYRPGDNGGIARLEEPFASRFTAPVRTFSGGGGLVSTATGYARP